MCGRYFPRLARQYSVQRACQALSRQRTLDVTSFWVTLARRTHPFPSRTRQLSSSAPMVLHAQVCGRVGRRPVYFKGLRFSRRPFVFFCTLFPPILFAQPFQPVLYSKRV